MSEDFVKTVKAQAVKELREDAFRAAVFNEKCRLIEKRSLWDRLFPWQIIIRRKL